MSSILSHLGKEKNSSFHKSLKDEVFKKVEEMGRPDKDQNALVLKAGILFLVWIILFAAYLFLGKVSIFATVTLSIAWALVMASIQMAVMHDASHGSTSKKAWVNKLLLNSISFAGGSPSLWVEQHCKAHHSFTNVKGKDHDIDTNGLLRLCSNQEYKSIHRYQHIYAWFLYPLFILSWVWWGDFRDIIYNTYGLSRKRLRSILFETLLVKAWHVSLFIILPLITIQSLSLVLIGYFVSFGVMGFVMVVVFQLAHISFVQEFNSEEDLRKTDWALFQLASTANFATDNKFLSWYIGGLNHQIEHHIFPYLSHTHYPEISRTVKRVCLEHGVAYNTFPTLREAIMKHQRHLKLFGLG